MGLSYGNQNGAPDPNQRHHALISDFSPSGSVSSGTFVTLASSAPTAFSGRPVLLALDVSAFATVAGTVSEYAIQIDSGADIAITKFFFNTTGEHHANNGHLVITPAEGTRTIRVRWRRIAGSGVLTADINDYVILHGTEL